MWAKMVTWLWVSSCPKMTGEHAPGHPSCPHPSPGRLGGHTGSSLGVGVSSGLTGSVSDDMLGAGWTQHAGPPK